MVNTTLKDSIFNFDDLVAFHTEETDSINKTESESFKYDISNIELKDANFYFNNRNVNHVTHIDDFSIFMENISWDKEEKSNADIKFNFQNGGYLETSLNINPVDGDYDASVNIKDLILAPFYEYIAEYAHINSIDGYLNTEIKIEGNINKPIDAVVSGRLDVNNLIVTDKKDNEVIKSKRLDLNLKRIDYANTSYEIDSLTLFQPYVYFEMDTISNNLFKIFKWDSNTEDAAVNTSNENLQQTDTTANNFYYALNSFQVNDGIMDYSDNLTGKRFDYHLSNIKINSDGIDSKKDWVNIYSDMLLNKRGKLIAKLGYNPLDMSNLNLNLAVEDFSLSDVNIYSQHYMGHSILLGDFYYYSNSKISNANIVSENSLLVKNVKVKKENNGLYNLPLRFALFILKDRKGDINLEVPVLGDLNNPEINIWKMVWTTLKNRITGAAASPIKSLATLVDVNPKDYEELVFQYTDTIPNENQLLKLNKLLEMETLKEGLKIELKYFVDPDLQRDAVVLLELGKQYYQENNKDYLDDKKGFENYIYTKANSSSLNLLDAAYMLINPQTIDSLTNIYNNTLIENTINYLKTSNPSTRIDVTKFDKNEPENLGSLSKFKIKFDLLDVQTIQQDGIKTND
ncbi:hypothetical protein APS56_11220 [Pseudalgibacter alginicilyticus]|uniref:Uncharacterized protein n=1 Tax=Pseudalgibacter alginicilyticus TaxID=1736674 RepID=A0A0P0CHK7_9FLAO|nr:DUF748 domain-containing protein [Pseudalgibacter alginicilyticus]ALJ05661.1 hypothetical protein APS56_11220 [Pseudalgibacter alginicilyticus]